MRFSGAEYAHGVVSIAIALDDPIGPHDHYLHDITSLSRRSESPVVEAFHPLCNLAFTHAPLPTDLEGRESSALNHAV
jgi:hypothetical protein